MRLVAVGVMLLSMAACNDEFEASYATSDEARKAGAFDRGWLPSLVPASAEDIKERHNIDTNEVAGSFRAPPSDLQILLTRLEPVAHADSIRGPRIQPVWWAPSLAGEIRKDQLASDGIQVARDAAGKTLFAVNMRTGTVHYWSVSS